MRSEASQLVRSSHLDPPFCQRELVNPLVMKIT